MIVVPDAVQQPPIPLTAHSAHIHPAPKASTNQVPAFTAAESLRQAAETLKPAVERGAAAIRKVVSWITAPAPQTADARPRRDTIEFFGPGRCVDLGFGPLESPLVYATGYRFERTVDASLVELPLPVHQASGDCGRLSYWPSYHDCSPQQRARYLNWLYTGRSDPTIDLGYVFIYFYGLERRALVEGLDHGAVIGELSRLLTIYRDSRSFRTYATQLLWLTIYLASERGSLEPALENTAVRATSEWPKDSLNFCLTRYAATATPVPPDLAFIIVEQDERAANSVIVKRHRDAFRTLFTTKLAERFPSGFHVEAGRVPRVIDYRPASGTLLATPALLQHLSTLKVPDVLGLRSQFTTLVRIWDECVDDLKAFDRASRNSDQETITGPMYEALPPELRQGDHPELAAWHSLLADSANDAGWPVVTVDSLARLKQMAPRPRLTKRQCEELLATADAMNLAIEPDARITGKNYRLDEQLVVFRQADDEIDRKENNTYTSAATLLRLGFIIAAADDRIDIAELDHISDHIERQFELSTRSTKRLEALKQLLVVQGVADMSVVRGLKTTLSLAKRRLLGRYLVGVAAADKFVTTDERQALRKVYRALDIPIEELEALLTQTVQSLPSSEEPTEVVSGTLPPTLNLDRIRAIREETAQVQELLHEALTASDPPTGREESPTNALTSTTDSIAAVVASDSPVLEATMRMKAAETLYDGLLESYHAILDSIRQRPTWLRGELQDMARKQGLMLGAVLETINEWSTERFGDWLLEETEGQVMVHAELLEQC